jgi:hypothetical protein
VAEQGTIFGSEASYEMLRNVYRRWYQGGRREFVAPRLCLPTEKTFSLSGIQMEQEGVARTVWQISGG